jgi:hypothetical protein
MSTAHGALTALSHNSVRALCTTLQGLGPWAVFRMPWASLYNHDRFYYNVALLVAHPLQRPTQVRMGLPSLRSDLHSRQRRSTQRRVASRHQRVAASNGQRITCNIQDNVDQFRDESRCQRLASCQDEFKSSLGTDEVSDGA